MCFFLFVVIVSHKSLCFFVVLCKLNVYTVEATYSILLGIFPMPAFKIMNIYSFSFLVNCITVASLYLISEVIEG